VLQEPNAGKPIAQGQLGSLISVQVRFTLVVVAIAAFNTVKDFMAIFVQILN
jgi:hypothetical protein